MPMVVNADNLSLKDVLQLLQINNESRGGIYATRHGNFESVIVTVAIAIRTFTEDAQVLFRRPRVNPVIVGGRKLGFAG
jgi:hypothetical protein